MNKELKRVSIVVLLMWLWITSYAVLLGAEINSEAEQQTAATLPDLAKDAVPKILGYDYQNVQRSSVEALKLMTPELPTKT